MNSFTGKLLIYCLVFSIYFIFSRSPYGVDQLYDQQLQDSIFDSYYTIYVYISVLVVGLLLCRSFYREFRSRSKKVIITYFRRFWFIRTLNSILAFVLFSYLLVQIIHYSVLFINRIDTTSISTTRYQDNLDDPIIQNYISNYEPNQNLRYHNKYKITTKKGLLNLPYHITINTL